MARAAAATQHAVTMQHARTMQGDDPALSGEFGLRVRQLVTDLETLADDPALEPGLATRVRGLAQVARSLGPSNAEARLTPRETEVVRLLASGHTMPQVANLLGITARTVAFHKYRAMETLGARSSAELVSLAIRRGIA